VRCAVEEQSQLGAALSPAAQPVIPDLPSAQTQLPSQLCRASEESVSQPAATVTPASAATASAARNAATSHALGRVEAVQSVLCRLVGSVGTGWLLASRSVDDLFTVSARPRRLSLAGSGHLRPPDEQTRQKLRHLPTSVFGPLTWPLARPSVSMSLPQHVTLPSACRPQVWDA